jgi:cyanate permease
VLCAVIGVALLTLVIQHGHSAAQTGQGASGATVLAALPVTGAPSAADYRHGSDRSWPLMALVPLLAVFVGVGLPRLRRWPIVWLSCGLSTGDLAGWPARLRAPPAI